MKIIHAAYSKSTRTAIEAFNAAMQRAKAERDGAAMPARYAPRPERTSLDHPAKRANTPKAGFWGMVETSALRRAARQTGSAARATADWFSTARQSGQPTTPTRARWRTWPPIGARA